MFTIIGPFEYAWEVFLAVYALLGVADAISYFSAATLVTLYVIGAVFNIIVCIVLTVGATRSGAASDALRKLPCAFSTQAGSLYFLRTSVGHIILATLAIIFVSKSGDLNILSFDTNLGPFLRFRDIHLLGVVHFMFVTFGALSDMRYNAFQILKGSRLLAQTRKK